MTFDLFVMVTDGSLDQVNSGMGSSGPGQCAPSFVHCGATGMDYPDARPMGYPFDRRAFMIQKREVANIEEFASSVPNMITKPVNYLKIII